MYVTYEIDDTFGISQLLMEQRYRADLDRFRSPHIYRGMSNVDFDIVTSLRRVCKHKEKKTGAGDTVQLHKICGF
jgi:hypothetical protein